MGADSQAVTPLPIKQLVGVFLLNLVLGFQINVIWPFLPFMVDWLRGTSQDSATYVGILTASYFVAQFVSSFVWGSLATRLGMRRCLMLGLLGVGSTFLCFGLSTSFEAAFLFRSMSGLLNGNVPILKAYMGTITDSTNQAKGMSVLALSWGLGSCVGPLLGGFLASPAELYPTVFGVDGVFGRLPFLLPCLTITGMCVVAFVALLMDLLVMLCAYQKMVYNVQTLFLLPPDDRLPQCCGPSTRRYTKVDTNIVEHDPAGIDEDSTMPIDEPELLTWRTILCRKSTLTACLAYVHTSCIYIVYGKVCVSSTFSAVSLLIVAFVCCWNDIVMIPTAIKTMSDEMFPVFGKTPILQGGLDFEATDIGSALSVGGVVLIIYQTLVYPRLVRKLGLIQSFNSGCMMTLVLVFVFPFIHLLAKNAASPVALWGALLLLFTWRMVASANCFIGSMIIVNNSVDHINLNRVNAVCQALASLFRAVLPLSAGALWSALMTQPWPIQPHGLYIGLTAMAMWMVINGRMLDPRCGASYNDRKTQTKP